MVDKLLETFLQICQYLTKYPYLQAIEAIIMFPTDEESKVLQMLLYLLGDVTAGVKEKQMIQSIFLLTQYPEGREFFSKGNANKTKFGQTRSERFECKSSHDSMAECKKLFKVPKDMRRYQNLSYTEQELKPLTLKALEYLSNDKLAGHHRFFQDYVDNLYTEVKEKFKDLVNYSTSEQAELSYKKVRKELWLRLQTIIKDPTTFEKFLKYLLKEQYIYDLGLLDSKTIKILDR